MKFHILASGSKGNATFVYEDNCGILIDCGISRKQLLYRLNELGFKEEDMMEVAIAAVEAVFDWKAFLEEAKEEVKTES